MTLTRCLAKLCPLMNELKQAYLPNKHNKPAKFFLTFADALHNSIIKLWIMYEGAEKFNLQRLKHSIRLSIRETTKI